MKNNTNKFNGAITALFFLSSLLSVNPSAFAADKHSLWKIQSERNTVYLLGSVHVLKKDNFPLASEIEQAYNDAELLVFEINLDSASTPAAQQFVLSRGLFNDGRTLNSVLSDSVYNLAKKLCVDMGLNIKQLNILKPWMFSVTLLGIKLQQIGFNPEYGVDKYFFNKAKKDGKSVQGLETLQLQLSIFDDMSLETQEKFVLQLIKEFEIFDEALDELVLAWKTGNSDRLSELLLDTFKQYPDLYQSMVIQRNKNWLGQILKYLNDDKNYLIVVGAGHMIGNEGLLSLLKKKGYKAEQL